MARFEAELYRKFRITYPLSLFELLKPYCQVNSDQKLQVLDLGAGTGLASQSFLRFYPECELTLVEPDPAMLEEALRSLEGEEKVNSLLASAETFDLPPVFDVALIASAWHWMKPGPTLLNLNRALKPGGAVWLAEYQFPKALGALGLQLNEWVRREFNIRWKPSSQVPRGNLEELSEPFRESLEWSQVKSFSAEETHSLNVDTFLGVIFSQSRYLAFEAGFTELQKAEYRSDLKNEMLLLWGSEAEVKFNYSFRVYVFRRRNF